MTGVTVGLVGGEDSIAACAVEFLRVVDVL